MRLIRSTASFSYFLAVSSADLCTFNRGFSGIVVTSYI